MKRTLTLAMIALIPVMTEAQVPGVRQENAPTPRSFFRRARPTPEAQVPAVVETTPTPRATARPAFKEEATPRPRPTREPEREKPRETPKQKVTEKTKEPEKAKPTQEELALKEANRELSATLQLVTDFLQAANEGKYFDAARSLTGSCQRYFESELAPVHGSLKRVLDTITRDGTIRQVTGESLLRGEGARVDTEIVYSDSSTARFHFDLVKTKEGWKLDLNVKGIMEGAQSGRPSVSVTLKGTQTPAPTPAPTPTPAATVAPQAEEKTPQAAAPSPTPASALADAPWKK